MQEKQKRFSVICAFSLLLFLVPACFAEARASEDEKIVVIRDAEIETYLKELAAPIYRAAGIDSKSVSMTIVQNNAVNAFVAGGMNEFFYTGLLQKTDTPEQLVAVIAHETGHITGGHLIRGKEEMKNASRQAILATILAVAAGAATGNTDLAAGAAAGGAHVATRNYLRFSRAQEASADQAALDFLARAGISSRGLLEFFEKLSGQEMLPENRQDEYVRTHPLTGDRIDAVRRHVENSPLKDAKLGAATDEKHARMKAKLLGYLQPETALLRYAEADPRLFARYARTIALYRTGKRERALSMMEALLKEEPENPFFHELKGQILFENGRIDAAIPKYKKAVGLLPESGLLHQAYGHALLESRERGKENQTLDLAIKHLLESNRLEGQTPLTWRFLASAWGRKADVTKDTAYAAMAVYALAEEAIALGNEKGAKTLAQRAMKGLPKGSTYWLRAQDISLSVSSIDKKGAKQKGNFNP